MKLARVALFVTLLCLATLGWVRSGDHPPVQPGTQPIIITGVTDGKAVRTNQGVRRRFTESRSFIVRYVAYPGDPNNLPEYTLDVKAVGDMADRVGFSVTHTEKNKKKKHHLYGYFTVTVTAKNNGPRILDEDVQIDFTVTRKDSNGQQYSDSGHTVLTLDFPGITLGKPPTVGSAPVSQPGTQPIIITPPPPAGAVPQTSFTWTITAKVPKSSLQQGTLVFNADADPSLPAATAERVWITPAFLYQVRTTPSTNPDYVDCAITVTVKAYRGSTGFTKAIPVIGSLSIYDTSTGDLVTRSSVKRTFQLIFPR